MYALTHTHTNAIHTALYTCMYVRTLTTNTAHHRQLNASNQLLNAFSHP